jgi:transcriptional regulator with XRE-family HTH domain
MMGVACYLYRMVITPKAAAKFREVIDKTGIVEIAKILDVSVSTIRGYYTGRQEPGLDEAFKIQRLFRIPAKDWLIADETAAQK